MYTIEPCPCSNSKPHVKVCLDGVPLTRGIFTLESLNSVLADLNPGADEVARLLSSPYLEGLPKDDVEEVVAELAELPAEMRESILAGSEEVDAELAARVRELLASRPAPDLIDFVVGHLSRQSLPNREVALRESLDAGMLDAESAEKVRVRLAEIPPPAPQENPLLAALMQAFGNGDDDFGGGVRVISL